MRERRIVGNDKPGVGMLIMTKSSNGKDIYDDLLRAVLAGTFTPLQWEGFKPSGGEGKIRP
jgi:hypothetical protein